MYFALSKLDLTSVSFYSAKEGIDLVSFIEVLLWLFCTDPVQAGDVQEFSSVLTGVLLPCTD